MKQHVTIKTKYSAILILPVFSKVFSRRKDELVLAVLYPRAQDVICIFSPLYKFFYRIYPKWGAQEKVSLGSSKSTSRPRGLYSMLLYPRKRLPPLQNYGSMGKTTSAGSGHIFTILEIRHDCEFPMLSTGKDLTSLHSYPRRGQIVDTDNLFGERGAIDTLLCLQSRGSALFWVDCLLHVSEHVTLIAVSLRPVNLVSTSLSRRRRNGK